MGDLHGHTWSDLFKRFIKDYPNLGIEDYRPFVEGYLPTDRAGIILWCKNGDVFVYMPKLKEK